MKVKMIRYKLKPSDKREEIEF